MSIIFIKFRTYSPNAIVNASPLQIIGTKTNVYSPIFDGKVFVGQALEIAGGNSFDCQRSCQSNYHCLSWTWSAAGGYNPEICVHNYGRTQRKLSVPVASKIVSGPKYCKAGTMQIIFSPQVRYWKIYFI